jgi:hypothetical protein
MAKTVSVTSFGREQFSMRYYLEREPQGMGMIAHGADGDGTSTMSADPGALLIQQGQSFHGFTWAQLLKAAEASGYIGVGGARNKAKD